MVLKSPSKLAHGDPTVLVDRTDRHGPRRSIESQSAAPSDNDGTTRLISELGPPMAGDATVLIQADAGSTAGRTAGEPPEDKSRRLPWPARDQFRSGGTPPLSRATAYPPGSELRDSSLKNEQAVVEHSADGPGDKQVSDIDGMEAAQRGGANVDPVVGWLVVVQGPGKGLSFELGSGANAIGVDLHTPGQYSDKEGLVLLRHAVLLIYDSQLRRFFLQTGQPASRTLLEDQMVLTPTELTGSETIILGDRHFRLVPFCGPEFDWADG